MNQQETTVLRKQPGPWLGPQHTCASGMSTPTPPQTSLPSRMPTTKTKLNVWLLSCFTAWPCISFLSQSCLYHYCVREALGTDKRTRWHARLQETRNLARKHERHLHHHQGAKGPQNGTHAAQQRWRPGRGWEEAGLAQDTGKGAFQPGASSTGS